MNKPAEAHSVDDHFAGKDASVRDVCKRVLSALRDIGPVAEDAKKTLIHLVHVSAMAAVETRKGYLRLNLKADNQVESPRVVKSSRRVGFTSR